MTDAPEAASPLDELRADLAKKLEPKRLLKKFPVLGGKLVGEYKIAPKADVRAAAETSNDEYLLDECLVRVLVSDPTSPSADANGLVPLGAWSGQPELDNLKCDQRLADLLGFEERKSPEIALRLYEGNDLLLATHVGEIAEWSLNATDQAYSDFPKAA